MAATSKTRLPVCINVFSTLDYVEIVQLNDETKDIELATTMSCSFDPTTRQIVNLEDFTHGIREVFTNNRIPFTTPVVVVLPSLLTREFDAPTELGKDELFMMATSEAERFNLFKNQEAHLDLLKLAPSQYVYSAYPKTEIEKLQLAFSELKLNLKAIEINYFSTLRGLLATGTIAEEAASNEAWVLVVINEGVFFIGIMEGIVLTTLSETFLSQNIDTRDLIQEIKEDYNSFTRQHSFKKLVLINNNSKLNTDDVLDGLNIGNQDIQVAPIDQKPKNLASRGGSDSSLPCTLESIGGVFLPEIQEMPSLNLKIQHGPSFESIETIRKKAFYIGMAFCAVIFILLLICWGVLALIINMKTEEAKDIAKMQNKATPSQGLGNYEDVQQKLFTKKAYAQNIDLSNALVDLGKAVNSDSWLEKVQLTNPMLENPDLTPTPIKLHLEGESLTTDKLNALTNDLKSSLKRTDLTVPKIESSKKGDVSYWTWTIEDSAPAPTATAEGTPAQAPAAAPGPQAPPSPAGR